MKNIYEEGMKKVREKHMQAEKRFSLAEKHLEGSGPWEVVGPYKIRLKQEDASPYLVGVLMAGYASEDDGRFHLYLNEGYIYFSGENGLGGLSWQAEKRKFTFVGD